MLPGVHPCTWIPGYLAIPHQNTATLLKAWMRTGADSEKQLENDVLLVACIPQTFFSLLDAQAG